MKKVVKIFKHIFIPHIHNDYKPHFFREASISSILIVVIILLSVSVSSKILIKNSDMISAVLPAVLVDLANQDRLKNGETPLTRNSVLDTAARLKAEDMASFQYFAHTSPSGLTPWHWFNKAGYSFLYAGENLAVDFNESQDVENAWLNSPKHRENIMSNNFTEIGIATVDGYYNGSPTIYVVQMFGKPAFASNTETTPVPTTVPEIKTIKEKPIQVAVAPVVKGESIAPEKLETVVEDKKFVVVKNVAALDAYQKEVTPQIEKENIKYSTWQDRLTFMIPGYTEKIYQIFVWIILIMLLIMMVFELSRRHLKNISYGVLLMVIIFSFIYINKTMFVTSFLS